MEITITLKEFEAIVKKAFKSGENWGITYTGWFEPSDEDYNEQIGKVQDELFMSYQRKTLLDHES